MLFVRQWQTPGNSAGIVVWFTDGGSANVNDQDGYPSFADAVTGSWHYRRFDLSGYAGKTLNYVELDTSGSVASGSWDTFYDSIALVWADGTVLPLYNGQSSVTLYKGDIGGGTEDFAANDFTGAAYWPDQTTKYYHGDHLGSARLMTTYNGYPVWSAIFLPFGKELNQEITTNHYKFTGKERDSESGLDNFGARYNSSQYGRFMTPDPVMANEIRMINPQRWNQYSYAINNPLGYTDPDGRDAAVVNPSGMVGGFGHSALVVIHDDGSASYASFGPVDHDISHVYGAVDMGLVTSEPLSTVQFGADGTPTAASMATLKGEVGKILGGVDPSTIRVNYFKISEADTIALANWVKDKKRLSDEHKLLYTVVGYNCAVFCQRGLVAANVMTNIQFWGGLKIVPNTLFSHLQAQQQVPKGQVCTRIGHGQETCHDVQ